MPAIKSIDFSDGIKLIKANGTVVEFPLSQITAYNGTKEELEALATTTLQEFFEVRFRLNSYEADHRVRQDPPVLRENERIDGNWIVISTMFLAVHIFNFPVTATSDYTIRCSRYPITGDWWL